MTVTKADLREEAKRIAEQIQDELDGFSHHVPDEDIQSEWHRDGEIDMRFQRVVSVSHKSEIGIDALSYFSDEYDVDADVITLKTERYPTTGNCLDPHEENWYNKTTFIVNL